MINCIHNKKADQIYSLGGRYYRANNKKAVLVSLTFFWDQIHC